MLKDYEFKTDLIGRPFREGKEKGFAEGLAEGRVEGRVEALLGVLEAREIEVPEAARARIAGTTEIAALDTMLRKAAHVERVEDLFEDESLVGPGRDRGWFCSARRVFSVTCDRGLARIGAGQGDSAVECLAG